MPEGQNDSWDQMDLMHMLGLDPEIYQHTHFPPTGVLNEVGLSTPATSMEFLEAFEIWD